MTHRVKNIEIASFSFSISVRGKVFLKNILPTATAAHVFQLKYRSPSRITSFGLSRIAFGFAEYDSHETLFRLYT